jgi:hypothetical protein
VVLQGDWRAEHSHDAVAGELVDRPAEAMHYPARAVDQLGHYLAQSLGPYRHSDVHRMHDIGEEHRHLLVLGRLRRRGDRLAALVTELRVRWQLGIASGARQSCRRHATPPPIRGPTTPIRQE